MRLAKQTEYSKGAAHCAAPQFVFAGLRPARDDVEAAVKVWYPTPGFRDRRTGAFAYVGYNGYDWSSTASGTNANHLSFNYGNIYPSSTISRGRGFQVRCLRE